MRRDTDLYNQAGGCKVIRRNIGEWRSKPSEGRHDTLCVLLAASDPKINVAGGAREPMGCQRISSYQQKLNAGICERGEYVVEVGIEQPVSP